MEFFMFPKNLGIFREQGLQSSRICKPRGIFAHAYAAAKKRFMIFWRKSGKSEREEVACHV